MHYDFGLRSVKAVVLLARDYLKKERRYISFAMFILSSLEDSVHVIVHVYSYRNDTAETVEKKALLQALQDSELSKLLSSDAQVMNMLLWDLFKVDTQETTEDILKVINDIVFCVTLLLETFVSGYSIKSHFPKVMHTQYHCV